MLNMDLVFERRRICNTIEDNKKNYYITLVFLSLFVAKTL